MSPELAVFIIQVIIPFMLVVFCMVLILMLLLGTCKLLRALGKRGWQAFVPIVGAWSLARASGASNGLAVAVVIAAVLSGTTRLFSHFLEGSAVASNSQDIFLILHGIIAIIQTVLMFLVHLKIARKIDRGVLYAILMTLFSPILYWHAAKLCSVKTEGSNDLEYRKIRNTA